MSQNKFRKKATDIEVVTFLNRHIDNPCEVEVAPGQIENIRDFLFEKSKGNSPDTYQPSCQTFVGDKNRRVY